MNGRSGFTLLEIMIVVAIIGLLAVIAIPAFMKSRLLAQKNVCVNNLRQIDSAKEQAALEGRWTNGRPIDMSGVDGTKSNVNLYIKGVANTTNSLTCPANGTYFYNAIGTSPTCDVSGHLLPAP